jgi:uncharacterized protein (DUF433 family)
MASDLLVLVGLLTHYSNRPDLCDDLGRAAELLRAEVAREALGVPGRVSARSVQPEPRIWRVADRLTESEVRAIVERFEQGTPKHILADEYGICLTAFKRLLKNNNARQPWQVSDRLTVQDVEALLQAFHEGTPKWKLADKYGISMASVKRLIRRNRNLDHPSRHNDWTDEHNAVTRHTAEQST